MNDNHKIGSEDAAEYQTSKGINRTMLSPSDQAVVDQAAAILLKLVNNKDALTCPEVVKEYVKMELRAEYSEVFAVLFTDNRHRPLAFKRMFFGTVSGATVYPREVVKEALICNAAACFLVHNHPSGIAEPSRADQALTGRLKDALDLVDVRVLDHLVVGDNVVSMAERGLM